MLLIRADLFSCITLNVKCSRVYPFVVLNVVHKQLSRLASFLVAIEARPSIHVD